MSVSFDKVNAGDELWDCRYERAGNTASKRWSCWTLIVVSVNREKRTAVIRWNGNREQTVTEHYFRGASIKRTRAPDPAIARRARWEKSRKATEQSGETK